MTGRFLLFVLPVILIVATLTTITSSEHGLLAPSLNEGTLSKSVMDAMYDDVKPDIHDYIWPTDASRKVTSSFAEYRTTHFHGGIDISTNGQTGYKVFAVSDGYVARVRITPNGYGKMLYVKHPDGYYSVYAHLLAFNDSITSRVRTEQYRRGTYAIDLSMDSLQVPVKKGDVVAFTGESGFGPPHLHFELRDEHLNPFNPLLCNSYSIKDNIPPRIVRLMVSPLNGQSMVENASRAKIMSRFPGKGHQFRLPQTLRVHGQIGFGVDAFDRSEGTYGKEGVHSMEFYLDDSLRFAMHLDRVPAEETKEIDLHYDFPTILHGWGKFQKLYIDSGNTLPFYNRSPIGTGIINTDLLTEGEHEFKIACKDIQGNTTELNGKILANHQPDLSIMHVDDEDITLTGNHIDAVEKIYVYGKKNSAPDWNQHTLGRGRFERDGEGIELPVNTTNYDVIKIVVESAWGSHSNPLIYFKRKPDGAAREIHIVTDVLNDFVRCTISSTGVFTSVPQVYVQGNNSSQTIGVEAVDLYKYSCAFVPSLEYGGRHKIRVAAEINGKPVSAEDVFELYPVTSSHAITMQTVDGHVKISADSGAVYRTLFIQPSKDMIGNSPVYILEPQDVLLNRGIKISVDASDVARKDYLGLYFRANGGWIFQTSTSDSNGRTFSTVLARTLGELALMHDSEPPSFSRLRVSASAGKALVAFRYHDNLSGVDTDEIKMYIDNAFVIPEIDGEHNQVWYKSDVKLSRGRHAVRITMADRMKNSTEIQRSFTVR